MSEKHLFKQLVIILLIVTIAGCSKKEIVQPLPTYTQSPTVPIFSIPTITAEQEIRLAETLQSENCDLPCYLTITPGKTSWSSAQLILSELGANFIGDYYESGLRGYEYTLKIGVMESSNAEPVSGNLSEQLEIHQYLIFTIEDPIVQRIQVSIETINDASRFHNYWSRYSPQALFAQLGSPDAIYFNRIYSINDGTAMVIVYESLGIVMEFDGWREDNSICPSFQMGSYAGRWLYLTNKASRLSLFPENGRVVPTNRDVWLPIDEVLGISVHEFYNQLLSDSSACFNVNITEP